MSALRLVSTAPAFDSFWTAYPKRVAKRDALKAWEKLSEADKAAALAALPNHVSHWKDTDPKYIPHPASWLNGWRWEDDLPKKRVSFV
jgi:hypothetical protein